jgi:hypothetical protein
VRRGLYCCRYTTQKTEREKINAKVTLNHNAVQTDFGNATGNFVLNGQKCVLVIARSERDEAIQIGTSGWIASLPLAMTSYAAFARSAIATSERKIPVAPLSRAGGEFHSSKNTTLISGRTRAPAECLAM